MPRVYVSVGSNIQREAHIRSAVRALSLRYGKLLFSSVYDSRSVGFDGPDFYNLVIGLETNDSPEAVADVLKALEVEHGRDRTGPRFSDRTLDLDLLLYGDSIMHKPGLSLPRAEILEQAFVLAPLAEIAGDEVHPVLHKTFRELWQSFDATGQELRRVELSLEEAPGAGPVAEPPP